METANTEPTRLISRKAARDRLNVSRATMWRIEKRGLLKPVQLLDGLARFVEREVEALIAGRVAARDEGPLSAPA